MEEESYKSLTEVEIIAFNEFKSLFALLFCFLHIKAGKLAYDTVGETVNSSEKKKMKEKGSRILHL